MSAVRFLTLVFLSIFYTSARAKDPVPVLLWGNKLADLPTALAGHTLPKDDFNSKYLAKVVDQGKQNIVAFLQDRLSLDDITKHGDVYNQKSNGATFQHLKNAMEKFDSTHLPSVDSAMESLQDLEKNFIGKVHHIKEPYSLSDLPLDKEASNLLMVHLPETGLSEKDFQKSLGKIDEIIGKVTDHVKSLKKPFTALYTADKPSKNFGDALYSGRHLLAADNQDYTFLNVSGCLFFFARSIKFEVLKENNQESYANATLKPLTSFADGTTCDNGTVKLVMEYKEDDLQSGLKSLKFVMVFNSTKFNWVLQSFHMSYAGTNTSLPTSVKPDYKQDNAALDVNKMINTPKKFSYSCTQPGPIKQTLTGKNGTDIAQVTFSGLQIQMSPISDNRFGTPDDCVGFFTIGIWSGIITTFILVAILAFGLGMIANIKTMDRFDDPKGKTISVAAGGD